jgi:hypothetical protein
MQCVGSYLESLPKFIAHNVVDQRIYARRNVIQDATSVGCEHEDISDAWIVNVLHGPHVGEALSMKWSPTEKETDDDGNWKGKRRETETDII